MNPLRKFRKSKGWTVREMAQVLATSYQQIREIERGGKLPTLDLAEKIRKVSGIGMPSAKEGHRTKLQRLASPTPYDLPIYSSEAWNAKVKTYSHLIGQLKPAPIIPGWLPRYVRCDSALEVLAWILLIHAGAQAGFSSPHELGFDQHPIMIDDSATLGARRLPHFFLDHPKTPIIIWPQVTIKVGKYIYRIDGLVLYLRGNARVWAICEIDGSGHQAEKDAFRSENLQMTEFRFSSPDILGLRFVETLLSSLL